MRFGELIRCFRCFFNKEKEREKKVCGVVNELRVLLGWRFGFFL